MNEDNAFFKLGLSASITEALIDLGFEEPTPIQSAAIPTLLEGRDVIGRAQTGTGKTAAFSLPILNTIDLDSKHIQALILAPTRELAIQVADAIRSFGAKMPGLKVVTIYGGQPIETQLKALNKKPQIAVGTPGRIMDHIRRNKLKLKHVRHMVLDEADEMLRMGFIEDVEWIMSQLPEERQAALFSATMPNQIRSIAEQHMTDPVRVEVKNARQSVDNIEQKVLFVKKRNKADAVGRFLETTVHDGVLIFAKTQIGCAELADTLQVRGFPVEPLHGGMNQSQRERVIKKLRDGSLDIVVATDVAARGIDVTRISHVLNYDLPYETESYVHRIGRTGRAGRAGTAILFVTPADNRFYRKIQHYAGDAIQPYHLPNTEKLGEFRRARWVESLKLVMDSPNIAKIQEWIEAVAAEEELSPSTIAAAALAIATKNSPLFPAPEAKRGEQADRHTGPRIKLFLDLGRQNGLQPKDITGMLWHQAEIPGRDVGPIHIYDPVTLLELPEEYLARVMEKTQGETLRGQPFEISVATPEQIAKDEALSAERGNFRRPRFDNRGGNEGRRGHRGQRPSFNRDERGGPSFKKSRKWADKSKGSSFNTADRGQKRHK